MNIRRSELVSRENYGDHVVMLIIPLAGVSAHEVTHPLSLLMAFQAATIDSNQMKWLVIFVGIAAVSLAIVAIFFLAVIIGGLVAYKEASKEIKVLKSQANQLVDRSQTLIAEFTPQIRQITAKVDTITGHVERLAALVHEKADEISPTITAANKTVLEANETVRETVRTTKVTAQEANEKTRAQITRVDKMISGALDATARLGVAIEQGISKPGREVAGVIAGLKAGLQTFAGAAQAFRPRPVAKAAASTPGRPAGGSTPPTRFPVIARVNEPVPAKYPTKPDSEY